MTIPRESLDSWFDTMTRLVSAFLKDFEARFGYPPGANVVVAATGGAPEGLHSDLADFYARISEVSLPDLGNGLFVHPAESVVSRHGYLPAKLSGFLQDTVTVFGSDGGGGLFALNSSGDRVYHLTGGTLIDRTYEATESNTAVVANNLWEFLRSLIDNVRNA